MEVVGKLGQGGGRALPVATALGLPDRGDGERARGEQPGVGVAPKETYGALAPVPARRGRSHARVWAPARRCFSGEAFVLGPGCAAGRAFAGAGYGVNRSPPCCARRRLGDDADSRCAQYHLSAKAFSLRDRKSTRLNSSHEWISYAVFCL